MTRELAVVVEAELRGEATPAEVTHLRSGSVATLTAWRTQLVSLKGDVDRQLGDVAARTAKPDYLSWRKRTLTFRDRIEGRLREVNYFLSKARQQEDRSRVSVQARVVVDPDGSFSGQITGWERGQLAFEGTLVFVLPELVPVLPPVLPSTPST